MIRPPSLYLHCLLERVSRPAWLAASLVLAAVTGCATHQPLPAQRLNALLPADFILFGEQHDAPTHHQLERQVIEILGVQNRLSAVVMEMAERGRNTLGLPPRPTESQVRASLGWDDASWPWSVYGPVVMAAVDMGVPVYGANLPRDLQRRTMKDLSLDLRLKPSAFDYQREAIRQSHCDLLAEAQIAPMARIQIARDLSMAETLLQVPRPAGRTVLLIAGAGHVLRSVGIPAHLPDTVNTRIAVAQIARPAAPSAGPEPGDVDQVWTTAAQAEPDHCAELKQRLGAGPH
jgi:uncharacterized iron-regulated protein